MLRRRSEFVVFVERSALTSCALRARGGSWEKATSSVADPSEDLNGRIASALMGLEKALSSQSRPRIRFVLGPSVCPGIMLDLGSSPVPTSIRQRLAEVRFAQVLGLSSADWIVRIDDEVIQGGACAFACPRYLPQTLVQWAKSHGSLIPSIRPLVSWGAEQLKHAPDGSLAILGPTEAILGSTKSGRIEWFETLPTPSALGSHMAAALRRRGANESTHTHVVACEIPVDLRRDPRFRITSPFEATLPYELRSAA